MFIDFIEVKNEDEGSKIGAKKMKKLKNLKKFNFSLNLSKIIIKSIKKASISNKDLISVTRRAGCLIPTRRVIRCSGKSSAGGSATFL